MKRIFPCVILLTLASTLSAQQSEVERWWAHVARLADDNMQGRQTGSKEHRVAAEYVADQFRKAGLKPGAGDSYLQPVAFVTRAIDEANSRVALVRDGVEEPVKLGDDAALNARVAQSGSITAPLVFAGYGLVVPEVQHDDLTGLDLKDKVVVILPGSPRGLSAPLYGYYGTSRWQTLRDRGALGVVTLQNPRAQDVPWERQMLNRLIPQMAIDDPSMDDSAGQRFALTVNPAQADKWLAGSGHTFQSLLTLADTGQRLPTFPLRVSLRATVAMKGDRVTSDNVVGVLPGTDPALRDQWVVLTAHLDHLGTGTPVKGDGIYNGAMDNASGIATLIETAALAGASKGFRRSLAFVAVTAEEKGLLGSRYFAVKPSLPSGEIVANLNTDMFLPLFPLKSIVAQGLEESDLAGDLRAVASAARVEVLTDPEPERGSFTRSDQYSFIRRGIPALSLKVGYTRDSPEHEILKRWRTERYHAVSDDLSQPIDKESAVAFNKIYVKLVEAVANRQAKPQWNADSFFKRFAAGTP